MTRSFFAWIAMLTLGLLPMFAAAAPSDPETLVKDVTEEVMATLDQDGAIQAGDRPKAIALIEDKIAPHFDFTRMTTLAVGAGWRQLDAAQREALTREFRSLLVRTYANALTGYRGQQVRFRSAPSTADGREATVRSEIRQPGGKPISVDYRLAVSDGEWKVYDVVVENISLVTNYRSSFAAEIGKGGADRLIETLQRRNLGAATTAPGA